MKSLGLRLLCVPIPPSPYFHSCSCTALHRSIPRPPPASPPIATTARSMSLVPATEALPLHLGARRAVPDSLCLQGRGRRQRQLRRGGRRRDGGADRSAQVGPRGACGGGAGAGRAAVRAASRTQVAGGRPRGARPAGLCSRVGGGGGGGESFNHFSVRVG